MKKVTRINIVMELAYKSGCYVLKSKHLLQKVVEQGKKEQIAESPNKF